ncbi:MAG: signal peptidase II [Clostridiales bacterium]|nr:signal peptidase II [Clostridiales bacterium]
MVYILIALAVFLLDSNMKNYIEQKIRIGEKKDILKGKITVKREYNSGFCLNVLDDKTEIVKKVSAIVFAIVTLAFILILPSKRMRLQKLGLALCIGGGASNLKDRFERGKVVDYFSFNIKSIKHIVFNLADIFIIVGSFLMLLSNLFHRKIINESGQILKEE